MTIQQDRARAGFVVNMAKCKWPILFPEEGKLASFVVLVRVLTVDEFSIYPGRLGSSLFKGTPNTNILAVRLQF